MEGYYIRLFFGYYGVKLLNLSEDGVIGFSPAVCRWYPGLRFRPNIDGNNVGLLEQERFIFKLNYLQLQILSFPLELNHLGEVLVFHLRLLRLSFLVL